MRPDLGWWAVERGLGEGLLTRIASRLKLRQELDKLLRQAQIISNFIRLVVA